MTLGKPPPLYTGSAPAIRNESIQSGRAFFSTTRRMFSPAELDGPTLYSDAETLVKAQPPLATNDRQMCTAWDSL